MRLFLSTLIYLYLFQARGRVTEDVHHFEKHPSKYQVKPRRKHAGLNSNQGPIISIMRFSNKLRNLRIRDPRLKVSPGGLALRISVF